MLALFNQLYFLLCLLSNARYFKGCLTPRETASLDGCILLYILFGYVNKAFKDSGIFCLLFR